MLGIREFIILFILLGVPLLVGALIWAIARRASAPTARLARLEALRAAGSITPAEYERQRAAIISRV